jgi:hypothetical protein
MRPFNALRLNGCPWECALRYTLRLACRQAQVRIITSRDADGQAR